MTQDIEGLVTSISMNQVLVAILEEHGKIVVPTLRFLDANVSNKELVIDKIEKIVSFDCIKKLLFSLRKEEFFMSPQFFSFC